MDESNKLGLTFLSMTMCMGLAWPGLAHAQEAPPEPPVAPQAESAPAVDVAPPPPPPEPVLPPPVPPAPVTPPPAPIAEVVVVTPPPAALPVEAKPAWSPVFTGSYFTRYEVRANYDDMGVSRGRFLEGDAAFFRLRFGIGTGLMDVGKGLKVALQFTPQASGVLGSLGPNTVADATLGLHEGYARVQGKIARFDAGRFEMNYGDALVIGNLDWNETARSFDGVRARLASSPTSAWLDLFATLVDEGRDPNLAAPSRGFSDGDLYFYGAYAALGPMIKQGLDLDVYVLGRGWHEGKGIAIQPGLAGSPTYRRESAHEVTVGARAKQKIAFFDYRFEGGIQAGSRPGAAPTVVMMAATGTEQPSTDVLAYQADLELGVSALGDKLRLGLEGIYASGDDPDSKGKNEGWDELYPTAHKWLGLADVFNQGGIKRTNVASGVLHVTAKATQDLTFQADGHLFSRVEKVAGQDGFAGSEVDVGIAYQLAKGLKVRGLYAVFMPDSDFYPVSTMAAPLSGEADPIHFGEVELRYDLMP